MKSFLEKLKRYSETKEDNFLRLIDIKLQSRA